MSLAEVVELLAREVDGLDPSRTSGADAARLVGLFDRVERLGAAGKALMVARAVDCRQWARDGSHSPQEWLSNVSGVAVGAAQRMLDTAEQAVAQPVLADALKAGELSPAQAAEISSAVADNPGAAPRLLRDARTRGFKDLKKACRAAKLAGASSPADDEATARRQGDARYCRTWVDGEGMGRVDARLDPLSFATFTSRFHPFEEEAFAAARKAGTREPVERYRADALVTMAQATAGGATATRSRVPSKTIVISDLAALRRGFPADGETCEIQGFGPVPVAVARQIMGDTFLAAVITDGVDIRRVVHLGRYPTEMQKTALAVRDRCCVVPRCGATERLEPHHSPGFETTHHTTLDELALLCKRHHDDVTHRGAKLTGGPGNWQWTPPPPHGEFAGPPSGMDPCAGPFDDPDPP